MSSATDRVRVGHAQSALKAAMLGLVTFREEEPYVWARDFNA